MNIKSQMLKLQRFSHSLKIVLNVFYWGAIMAACGSFIAAFVIKLIPDSHFLLTDSTRGHLVFSLNGIIRYNLNQVELEGVSTKNIYITILIMSGILFALAIPVLRQLVLVLKTVEDKKPFAKENSGRISIIGAVFIIGSFLIPAAEACVAKVMIDTLQIQNISTNYSANFYLIFTGIMMFILGGIFRYGSYLQHEYDETV